MIFCAAAVFLAAAPPAMVKIPPGQVQPFFRVLGTPKRPAVEPRPAPVETFWLDILPVTQGQLLEFVRDNPSWRRAAVPRLLADEHYLSRWKGDLELASPEAARHPATEVSWFAAQAYCQARGLRLPSLNEWELALEDQGRDRDALTKRILEWYQAGRSARQVSEGPANGYGVRDLVGLSWEWTLDFDTAPLVPDARGTAGSRGLFCGSGGAEAIDPADQAKFMRYAFRSSLKASYTTRDLGFRCAKDGLAISTSAAEPSPKFSSDSLYQLGASFTDASGKKVALSSLAGHPVLLSMVYTNCQASCPLTIAQMKAIAAKLDAKTKASARLVLVSFDPKRDTPARLASVAKERALSAPAWVLLNGTDDSVRELAAVIGFKYQPIEGGEFVHSNQLTVLGPDGVIRAQVSGDEPSPDAAIQALQR